MLTIDQNTQPAPKDETPADPTKVEAKAGTPEYEAQMAAAGKAHREQFEQARPDWLPEKFWNAESKQANLEALAKSYAELEKSRGTTPQAPAQAQTTEATQSPQGEDASWLDKYSQEVSASGALSEASYAELAAKGFSKAVVDRFIAGEQAQASQARDSVLSTVGGAEAFENLKTWAAGNLTADELNTFNKQVVASVDSSKMALQWLKTRYEQANGSTPKLLTGGTSAAPSNGFRSQEEVVSAIRDPRYGRDPAYRAEVQRRLASKQF